MITQWNDEEDMALQGLRPATQVIYLRGLRRFMDYTNGIVGIKRRVSYPSLIECCEFLPDPHSRQKADRKNKEGIRAAFAELERAGLIKKLDGDLVFLLPLAETDKSAQILNNPRATLEQPLSNNTEEPSNDAYSHGNEQPLSNPSESLLSNIHPITDNRILNEGLLDKGAIAPAPEKKQTGFVKPTLSELQSYIFEKNYSIDAELFLAHYESNGWMVGKSKMKCWKSTLVTWSKRQKEFKKSDSGVSQEEWNNANFMQLTPEEISSGRFNIMQV